MAELIIGILALLYGLYTIYLRVRKDSKAWSKLEKMKEFYGEKIGTIIHFISYTVVPIVIGIMGIAAYSMQGVTENVKISSMKSSALTIIDGARNALLSRMSLKAGYYYVGGTLLDKDVETPWGGSYDFTGSKTDMITAVTDGTTPACQKGSGSFIHITEDATTKRLSYSICLHDVDGEHLIYASENVLGKTDPEKSDYYIEFAGPAYIKDGKISQTK